jgi:ribosomal protein S18 acetylase RimI-like enzyme
MPCIRRLTPSDAAAFRAVRLAALELAPEAFATQLEAEAARPLAHFAAIVRDAAVFAAEHEGALVAIARLTPGKPPKETHKAAINGFFVRPGHRGRGIAGALMAALIEAAREKYEHLTLGVVAENDAAIRLYRRFGFVEFGREPRARKSGAAYQDLVMMWLPLTR